VSGVAGVGTHENVELGVRNEVHSPQIRALEAPLEGKMSLLGFPLKTKQTLQRLQDDLLSYQISAEPSPQKKIRQNVYI
jgi:hypothetical protein